MERGYRDLVAWQKSMVLVKAVYDATRSWPSAEQFGLTAQVRRAVVSIPANVAEGNGRFGAREFAHHLSIAHGSRCELETLLLAAGDQGFLSSEQLAQLVAQSEEVGRILRGLLKSLR
jgi:four helix bundle protein